MSDELIRKSEVIKAIKKVLGGYCMGSAVVSAINEIQPVNAVELPCKVGDTIFTTNGGVISESIVKRITIFKDDCLLTIKDFRLGNDFMIEEWDINPSNENDSKCAFFTREEAEKALEEMKNENK